MTVRDIFLDLLLFNWSVYAFCSFVRRYLLSQNWLWLLHSAGSSALLSEKWLSKIQPHLSMTATKFCKINSCHQDILFGKLVPQRSRGIFRHFARYLTFPHAETANYTIEITRNSSNSLHSYIRTVFFSTGCILWQREYRTQPARCFDYVKLRETSNRLLRSSKNFNPNLTFIFQPSAPNGYVSEMQYTPKPKDEESSHEAHRASLGG